MAARDCLGKIRWVRRLPVHTLLSLETVKDYQLLYFPNLVLLGASHHLVSSIPSRPILAWPCPDSFVRTGFQLTFSCRGSLIGCLINDILHSFFFLFIGIIPRHLIGCKETMVTRGLLAGLQPCFWTHTGGTGICQAEFPPAFISLAARQTSGLCQDVESKFLNTEEAWNLTLSPGLC